MKYIIIVLLSVLLNNSFGQFAADTSSSANDLATFFGGLGVTVNNSSLICPDGHSGTFTNAPAGLGISDGIILSTGKVIDLPGVFGNDLGIMNPQASQASSGAGAPGYDLLDSTLINDLHTTYTSLDACVLEIEVEVVGDNLNFRYVMGSEEYPEFVCNSFNDVFGFYVSGPNPAGGSFVDENIALIPGTTTPVAINSVNDGSETLSVNADGDTTCWDNNSAFYNPTVTGLVYDGYTTTLNAVVSTVPCQIYTFKLAVGDGRGGSIAFPGSDDSYDTGVFLEAGSFTSNFIEIEPSSTLGGGFVDAVEGCIDGVFKMKLDTAYNTDVMVGYDISGTAVNGVDYTLIADSVFVPAGDTLVEIPIIVLTDFLTEGTETVILTPYTVCGTLGNPSVLNIIDFYPHSATASSNILCDSAIITLTGVGAQFYSWRDSSLLTFPDSSMTQTISPLTETTTFYMDGVLGNCAFTDTVTVVVSQTEIEFVAEDISCTGANDGTYYMVPNDSANFPISYSFPFIASTDSIEDTFAPGFQFAQATDDLGCQFTDFYTFVDPAGLAYDYDSIPISCDGANDGQICVFDMPNGTYTMNVDTNGVLMDTFDFVINADTFCFGPLAPGVYDVSFTNDTLGCAGSFTTSLVDPNGMAFGYDTTNVSCAGSSDGKICIFDVIAGPYTANVVYEGVPMPPVNFNINSDTFCIGTLPIGHYEINLVNNNTLCNANFTVDLIEPDTLSVGLNSVGASLCAGGSIDSLVAIVAGGTQVYQYLWNNSETTPYLYLPTPGTYSVVVTDLNGCQDSASVTLVSPIPLYLDIEMDSALCSGDASGTAYVDSVSGGAAPYTYSWNTSPIQTNDTAFNVLAGQIILTVSDFNNCTVLDTVDVLEPNNPLSIALTTNVISCFGGDTCIDATVSGGTAPYTFLWSDGQTTEDVCGLVAGTYILTVTDVKGCMKVDSITVTEVPEITLTKDSTSVNCFGGSDGTATVNAVGGSGAYIYSWNTIPVQTSATATALASGNYTVVVSDANDASCTKSISVNITEPDSALVVTLDNKVDVLCFGASTGEINVNVAGGTAPYSYAWTGGSSAEDLSNAPANIYTLTVTDASTLCTTTYTDTIIQPADIVITVDNTTNISCFGGNDGAIDISVSGGSGTYTYVWNGGATTQDVSGLTFGTHQVTVSDGNCTKTMSVQLTQPADVVVSFNYSDYNGVSVSCNGGIDGTVEAVVVTGGSAPFTYTWDNGMTGNPISGIAANTAIIVTVKDANLCSYTQAIVPLSEPALLTLAKDSTNVSCAGYNDGTATIIPAGGTAPYSYSWSNGLTGASINSLAPSIYICNVTDANGCQESIQVTITEAEPIVVTTSADSVKCWGDADGKVIVTASGGNGNNFQYSIDGGLTFQTGSVFTDLTAGVYSEIIVKQDGAGSCLSTPVSQIIGQPDPMFIFINPADTTIQIQESVPLTINVDPATGYYSGGAYSADDITNIVWSPTEGLSCSDCIDPIVLTYEQSNEYLATVTYSPYGCETSTSATIQVENNLMYFVPNGFSPQGDGINDQFLVYGEALRDFNLIIFNRWGEKVFETNVQSQGWDGTFKGVLQNSGVFTYHLDAKYLDDKEISTKGSFTLIR